MIIKTDTLKRCKEATISPSPRKNPDSPKPGPKTVPVITHIRILSK